MLFKEKKIYKENLEIEAYHCCTLQQWVVLIAAGHLDQSRLIAPIITD